MKTLEEQLRSWKPRRPSPRIEPGWRNAEPYLGATLPLASNVPSRNPTLRWADWPGLSVSVLAQTVVPALVGLFLTTAILIQPGQSLVIPKADQPTLLELALSNQNFAPYLPSSFQPTANRWDTFGWTNESGSSSSMRSLTPSKAIDLQ